MLTTTNGPRAGGRTQLSPTNLLRYPGLNSICARDPPTILMITAATPYYFASFQVAYFPA